MSTDNCGWCHRDSSVCQCFKMCRSACGANNLNCQCKEVVVHKNHVYTCESREEAKFAGPLTITSWQLSHSSSAALRTNVYEPHEAGDAIYVSLDTGRTMARTYNELLRTPEYLKQVLQIPRGSHLVVRGLRKGWSFHITYTVPRQRQREKKPIAGVVHHHQTAGEKHDPAQLLDPATGAPMLKYEDIKYNTTSKLTKLEFSKVQQMFFVSDFVQQDTTLTDLQLRSGEMVLAAIAGDKVFTQVFLEAGPEARKLSPSDFIHLEAISDTFGEYCVSIPTTMAAAGPVVVSPPALLRVGSLHVGVPKGYRVILSASVTTSAR